MRLSCEVVEFCGLNSVNDPSKGGSIGQVRVVEEETFSVDALIVDLVIETWSLQGATAAYDTVNFVAFCEEKFGEV